MSTATALSKSDGVDRRATYSIAGDGNALTLNVGFQPRRVKVWDPTGVITWEWIAGLPATETFKATASALAVDTGSAITVTSKDTETAAQLAAGTFEPGVTLSATVLANGHTVLVWVE